MDIQGLLAKHRNMCLTDAEVGRLIAHVETQKEMITELQSSLTRAKAEGRREGLEEAAKIADDQNFDHNDCDGCRTARTIAAAIRQQAGQEGK